MVEILPINCFDTIITIKFNEFILCSTVTITDFELTGPGGIYSLNSITAPGCTNGGHHDREFTINTDSIFIDGNYELHLIGEVSDLCANPSDPGIVTFAIIGNRPAPLVATANSPCLGTTMQLDATHYTTATYQWTGPSEFTSSLQSPSIPNVSTNANGLYHVTATLSIDCILTSSVFVTINPSPPAGAKTIFHD